ncbi:MAG: NUDIX domain-containing protein [Candidatus Ratteibacteria bacterium]
MERTIFFIMGVKISLKNSNINLEKVDAIVNMLSKSEFVENIKVGESICLLSENLSSKYTIYTKIDENYETIKKCMENCFKISEQLKIKSLTFSTSFCKLEEFESQKVAEIMIEETLKYLSNKFQIEEINFVIEKEEDYRDFLSVFEKYLRNLTKKTYKNPIPTVDIIIEYNDGIVLIERKNYPFGWAIPGGFVEYGESCEQTAIREAKEETGLDIYDLKQLKTYSKPGRDPRFHTISTVFIAKGKGILKSGDDAKNASVFNNKNLPENIAFDHKEILTEYYKIKLGS